MNPENQTTETPQTPPNYNPASVYPTPIDNENRKVAHKQETQPTKPADPHKYARRAQYWAWFILAGIIGIASVWYFLNEIAPQGDSTMQWRLMGYGILAAGFSALVAVISLIVTLTFIVLAIVARKKRQAKTTILGDAPHAQ